jgi:hypothetical protein
METQQDVNIDLRQPNMDLTREEETCPICLDTLHNHEQTGLLVACAHVFHSHCIQEWMKNSKQCPMCRTNIRDVGGVDVTSMEEVRLFRSMPHVERRENSGSGQKMTNAEALDFFDYANRRVFRRTLNRPDTITFHHRLRSSTMTSTFRENSQEGSLRYTVSYGPSILVMKRRIFDLMWHHYNTYHREYDDFRYDVDIYYRNFLA